MRISRNRIYSVWVGIGHIHFMGTISKWLFSNLLLLQFCIIWKGRVMDDCSAEYAKIKIVLLRWARVSVPIWAGYVGQCGGQGAHLDKIWQMYWQPVHHRGRGTAIQHRFTCVCVLLEVFRAKSFRVFSEAKLGNCWKAFSQLFLLNFFNYTENNCRIILAFVHKYIE